MSSPASPFTTPEAQTAVMVSSPQSPWTSTLPPRVGVDAGSRRRRVPPLTSAPDWGESSIVSSPLPPVTPDALQQPEGERPAPCRRDRRGRPRGPGQLVSGTGLRASATGTQPLPTVDARAGIGDHRSCRADADVRGVDGVGLASGGGEPDGPAGVDGQRRGRRGAHRGEPAPGDRRADGDARPQSRGLAYRHAGEHWTGPPWLGGSPVWLSRDEQFSEAATHLLRPAKLHQRVAAYHPFGVDVLAATPRAGRAARRAR